MVFTIFNLSIKKQKKVATKEIDLNSKLIFIANVLQILYLDILLGLSHY